MAISSRLALWEQKIREEDKSPPPSSPPPLFSVIPGGFIKQLVRETEKESKEARRRKAAAFTAPEVEIPAVPTNQTNKTNNVPKPGSQQTSQDSSSTTQNSADIPGKEPPGAGDKDSTPVTSTSGERPQESGPTGTPAKRTLPFKRGVRRGDVLLMVAKLDPELAKADQKVQPRDVPVDKTPAPAKDSGGTKKGVTTGTSSAPQPSMPEKTRTRGVGDTGQSTKGGKCQGTEGKGSRDPQTIGQKEGESQSTEEQGTRSQAQEAGNKEQLGTAEKEGGGPPKKMEKEDEPKVAGAEVRPVEPPVPLRKWGGFLGWRSKWDSPQSKDRVTESHRKDEKTGDLQSPAVDRSCGQLAEPTGQPSGPTGQPSGPTGQLSESTGQPSGPTGQPAGPTGQPAGPTGQPAGPTGQPAGPTGQQQEAPVKMEGKVGRPQKKLVTPRKPRELPGVAAKTQNPEESCKAPDRIPTTGISAEAAKRDGQPESRVQGAGEPRVCTEEEVDVVKPQAEGHVESIPEVVMERLSTLRPMEEKQILQDPDRGGQSGDSDQAYEDRWYEAQKVWLVQKDGFTLATVLKPDEGTADPPAGRVRLCIDADRTVIEVDEEQVHPANPSELDQAEDLASLVSVNESSVMNTLLQRYRAQLPYTCSGPDLITLQPQTTTVPSSGKVPRGRQDGLPAHVTSLAQRAYWALLSQRRDQSIVALGRSGAGKTTCCEQVLEHLVGMAGSVDGRVSVEKLRATFTVLRAFGCVSTGHSRRATRFAMVMSLDFNATGRVTAAQLQTVLLENSRVARQPQGEGNFEVFSQLLAGMDVDLRTELNLHQMAESSAFGMGLWSKPEDKQKAATAFSQLRGAMELLGISEGEQQAIWRVLAAIYHLGAAGACKVGRKQFMRFEWANHAAEALGCDYEELNTATFKHHLRQIIEQMTSGPQRQGLQDNEACSGLKMTGVECVEGMASGLYQELFVAVVSLINRSFSSHHLSMASIMVVDTPGFQNPRHQGKDRAATFEELCYNYAQERLQLLFYHRTFVSTLERYKEEGIPVPFDLPESSPGTTVAVVDQNPSQVHLPAGRGAEDAGGLFWVLDEEVRVQGSSDSTVLERLRAAFEKKKEAGAEEPPSMRTCEQPLQCELFHQLGRDPVRYDLTGWLRRAKPNLAALEAPQILQQSKREELQSLFQARAKLPPVCRAVAGLEGTSQQALHRSRVVRRAFASSLAAVKRKAPCAQIKLQMDALISLLRRSRLHFIHCLVPTTVESKAGQRTPSPSQPSGDQGVANEPTALDIPALRVQLAGSHILEALRLHRAGYAEHMGLAQFRRRFQVLDPALLKKLDLTSEELDERKVVEELLKTLDLEKKAVAVGHSQVFLKAGVVSRLERQREKLVSRNIVLFQAACRGFLSRQEYKKLKIRRLATLCIQKNLAVFLKVKDWPWWGLLASLRPLLSSTLGTEQLRAKEEELTLLRQKLQKSENSRSELRQNTDLLESKVGLPPAAHLDLLPQPTTLGQQWHPASSRLHTTTQRHLVPKREVPSLRKPQKVKGLG